MSIKNTKLIMDIENFNGEDLNASNISLGVDMTINGKLVEGGYTIDTKSKCEYCKVDKLNLLIESDKIWNTIYFFIGEGKPLQEDDVDTVDNSVVLEIRNGQGSLRLGERDDMQCIDHSDKVEINYCPMCGRNLKDESEGE